MADLKINIGVDIGNAAQQVQKVKKEIVELGEDAEEAAVEISKVPPKLKEVGETSEETAKKVKVVSTTITQVKEKLSEAGKELTEVKAVTLSAADSFKKLTAQLSFVQKNFPNATIRIEELKAKLALLGPTTEQVVKPLKNIPEAIKDVPAALKKVEPAANSASKGLSKAFAGLRTLANIIPGIGIGGLVAIIAGPLVDALESLFDVSNKAGKALNDSLSLSAGSVGGTQARLEALVSIARDITQSDGARKEALGALNKEYDVFNGKLTLANINTAAATDLINKQSDALVRQAQIKGVEELITAETKKQAEARNKTIAEELSFFDKVKFALSTIGDFSGSGFGKALQKGIQNTSEEINKSKSAVDQYKLSLKGLLTEEAQAGTLFTEPKIKKLKEKIQKALKFTPDDLSKMFFDEGGVKLTVPAQVEIDFKKSLRGNSFASEGLTGILGPEALTELQLLGQLAGLGITTGIQDGLRTGVEGLRFPELKKLAEDATKKAADLAQQVGDVISSTLSNAISSGAEAIGKALAGDGGIQNIFGGLLTALSEGLKAIGQALVEYGIAKTIISKLKISGPAAIAAGIALEIFAAALLSKIPKFADGVTNFGGGLALVGERGPEVVRLPSGSDVIPNHQLGGLGAAQPIILIANNTIRGTDIVTSYHRASARNSRNG